MSKPKKALFARDHFCQSYHACNGKSQIKIDPNQLC